MRIEAVVRIETAARAWGPKSVGMTCESGVEMTAGSGYYYPVDYCHCLTRLQEVWYLSDPKTKTAGPQPWGPWWTESLHP